MSSISGFPSVVAFREKHLRIASLINGILELPAVSESALRRAVALGEPPEGFRSYVQKIFKHAYRITDEDMAALKSAGHSEDEILEVSVAAALGAALVRLEKGLAASHGATATRKAG